LRAREAGFRLIYEPGSEVFHHAKATSSIVANERKIPIWQRFEENKRRFYTRWGAQLAADERARRPLVPATLRQRPRVYDGFTFFNELDVLEIRLEELDSVVDVFVLVEATRTFSNRPKPLVFAENQARFARFRHRIRHVVVDDMPESADSPWHLEAHQRNAILRGLDDARPQDLVIISDVDEIPKASRISGFDGQAAGLEQTSFYYKLNCKNATGQPPGAWSVILRRERLRAPEETRRRRFELPLLRDAGWHFSYLGGPEAIRRKIGAFSHQELNREEFTSIEKISARVARGEDLFERPGLSWRYVPIDASFPASIVHAPDRWKHLIEHVGAPAVATESGR
jgi:beta-1,4-mannosyl-glycoprotein beta-1,4-N-acetylglucosaminyltransferase